MPTSATAPSSAFHYHRTAVWAPLGCLLLTVLLLGLAVTGESVLESLFLSVVSGLAWWATTLFFEDVVLAIDAETHEVSLTRVRLSPFRLKLCQEAHSYRLADLSAVWLEPLSAGGTGPTLRVALGFGSEWVPVTQAFTNTNAPRALQQDLVQWLQAKGHSVQVGRGPLPSKN